MEQDYYVPDFETLLEENLFAEWADVLCRTNSMFGKNDTASFIWQRAKHYAIGIVDSKRPVVKFRNRCHEIRNEFNYNECDPRYVLCVNPFHMVYSIVVGCVYTMVVFSADKDVAQQIIEEMPVYGTVSYCDIQNVVHGIIEKISNGELERDYDYTKEECGLVEQEQGTEEVDNATNAISSALKEKDELIQQLQEQLAVYEREPIVEDPHDKVRLEIVARLLENSGTDFEKFGNKAEAARMIELITDLPFQTCKNYMTNRDLNTTEHLDEVLKANISLKKLGMNWHL